jgi:hypothetical protein
MRAQQMHKATSKPMFQRTAGAESKLRPKRAHRRESRAIHFARRMVRNFRFIDRQPGHFSLIIPAFLRLPVQPEEAKIHESHRIEGN